MSQPPKRLLSREVTLRLILRETVEHPWNHERVRQLMLKTNMVVSVHEIEFPHGMRGDYPEDDDHEGGK